MEGSGGEDVTEKEEALVGEVAALRSDVSKALSSLQQSEGLASPELAPVLSSINSSLEALRNQVCAHLYSCGCRLNSYGGRSSTKH